MVAVMVGSGFCGWSKRAGQCQHGYDFTHYSSPCLYAWFLREIALAIQKPLEWTLGVLRLKAEFIPLLAFKKSGLAKMWQED